MEILTVATVALLCLIIGVSAGFLTVTVLIVRAASVPAWESGINSTERVRGVDGEQATTTNSVSTRVQGATEASASRSPAEGHRAPPAPQNPPKPRCALCEGVRQLLRLSSQKTTGK